MKILVADDSIESRKILETSLGFTGHEVLMAANGEEALEIARASVPDMIISDILMPGMDGFTLCREIKKDSLLNKIPFIFYTATYTDPESEKLAKFLGASRYIVKPVGINQFLEIINEVFLEFKKNRLPVPDRLLKKEDELAKMHERSISEKLDEKVRELLLYRKIFFNCTNAIAVIDTDGKYVEQNAAHLRLTGYSDEELFSMTAAAHWGEKKFSEIMGRLAEKGTYCGEFRAQVKSGREVYIELSAFPVFNERGRAVNYVAIERDISERKEMEEERTRLNSELAMKNRELKQILYISTHDLRTPLVNIQGYTMEIGSCIDKVLPLINSDNAYPDIKEKVSRLFRQDVSEALKYINASTSKIDSLVSGLLQLSRLGLAEIAIRHINMNRLIKDVCSNFGFQIKNDGIEVEVHELPPCTGDEKQVNQLFHNLMGNAIKFLDHDRQGKISITGRANGTKSIYCVEDNGIGIAPENQERVFEMFGQVDPGSGGEGLGLLIAQNVVERLNGKIWVESEPGRGSKFFVALPGTQNK